MSLDPEFAALAGEEKTTALDPEFAALSSTPRRKRAAKKSSSALVISPETLAKMGSERDTGAWKPTPGPSLHNLSGNLARDPVFRFARGAIHGASLGLGGGLNETLAKRDDWIGAFARNALEEQSQPAVGWQEKLAGPAGDIAGFFLPITRGAKAAQLLTKPAKGLIVKGGKKALGRKAETLFGKRLIEGATKAPGGALLGVGISKLQGGDLVEQAKQGMIFGGLEMLLPQAGVVGRALYQRLPGAEAASGAGVLGAATWAGQFARRHLGRMGAVGRLNVEFSRSSILGENVAEDAAMRAEIRSDLLKADIDRQAEAIADRRAAQVNIKRKQLVAEARRDVGNAVAKVVDAQRDAVDAHVLSTTKAVQSESAEAARSLRVTRARTAKSGAIAKALQASAQRLRALAERAKQLQNTQEIKSASRLSEQRKLNQEMRQEVAVLGKLQGSEIRDLRFDGADTPEALASLKAEYDGMVQGVRDSTKDLFSVSPVRGWRSPTASQVATTSGLERAAAATENRAATATKRAYGWEQYLGRMREHATTAIRNPKQIKAEALRRALEQVDGIKQTAREQAIADLTAQGYDAEAISRLADHVAQAGDETSQAMVAANQMHPATAALYKGAYLRRTYAGEPEAGLMERLFSQAEGLSDGGQGLYASAAPGKGATRALMMRHNFTTPFQRQTMGIEPFGTRFAKQERLGAATQGWGAQSQRLAYQSLAPAEYAKAPAEARAMYTDNPMPNTPAWGPLRGQHIPKPIYNHLQASLQAKGWLAKLTSGELGTGAWKYGKTIASSGTWMHNLLADMIFNFVDDPLTLAQYPGAAGEVARGLIQRAMRTPDPKSRFELARRALALGGTWASTEFTSQAAMRFSAGDPKFLDYLLRWPRGIASNLAKGYGGLDQTAKLIALEKRMAEGMSLAEAAEGAQVTGLDYGRLPAWSQKLRRGWFPFLAFPAAMVQQGIPKMLQNPSRALALIEAPRAYSEMMLKKDKLDVDALWAVAPDWWDRNSFVYYGKDNDGAPILINAATSLTYGDLLQMGQATGQVIQTPQPWERGRAAGLRDLLTRIPIGGPIPAAVGALARNQTSFGSAITRSDLPAGTQEKQLLGAAAEQLGPPAIGIAQDIARSTGPTQETPWRRTPDMELYRIGGLAVYRVDVGQMWLNRMEELDRQLSARYRQAAGAGAEFASMTPKEKLSAIAEAKRDIPILLKRQAQLLKMKADGRIPEPLRVYPSKAQVGTER